MARELDPLKLSSPRNFLFRMVVFLTLCSLVVVVLYKQIGVAFLANPGLNALIIGVLIIGIALAFRQVIRLFPEVNWVNSFRLADPGLALGRPPVLLAPMGGMGISFSSSLFGLAGSLALGFLDLQTSQAQNRFYTELEDWLSTTVRDLGVAGDSGGAAVVAPQGELRGAIERLKESIADSGSSRAATTAMANLAEAIQGLVHHMRTEQQMIRDWVDSQAEQHREIRRLLEVLVRENVHK